ncbi:MAG: polyprenyl synthetase family protein [Alphaproteobacteria bacterium]|nr:polyprenyl synthetase family protein [Alphaproteobacteria bacterium]MCB9975861.1 polyprenyl synthetase family protein [Rhodospirillales bacterium]
MQGQPAEKEPEQKSKTPLDELSSVLDHDMRQVNARILKSMESDVAIIPRLARYLIAAGGKRIRPLLTLACASIYDASMEKVWPLAAAVEFIHTATLLHDDVVDESAERRGQKAANMIFGNKASVLVGDFLFSKSFQLMVECRSVEILRILSDAAAVIAQGEVKQLTTANNIETPLSAYIDVIEAKTAALFAASCQIGPALTEAGEQQEKAMRTYGMQIGIAFQIVDDMLDYAADPEKWGKDIGDDFREGKMTAPVIFALENADEAEKSFWQRTIGNKIVSDGDFETALELINRHNGLEKSRKLAQSQIKQAKDSLLQVPEHPLRKTLDNLADFVLVRAN